MVGILISLQPSWAQGDQTPATSLSPGLVPQPTGDRTSGNDNSATTHWAAGDDQSVLGPSEINLPVDDSVKVTVEPLFVSNLVDRVLEPSTVTVCCPEALSVQLFIMPVDSPYGGVALRRPKLIASDNRPSDKYTLRWTGKEQTAYVKLFAVVRKQRTPYTFVRSRTIDLALGGMRYTPPPAGETGRPSARDGGCQP